MTNMLNIMSSSISISQAGALSGGNVFTWGLDAFPFVILSAATFQFLFNTSAIISANAEPTGLAGFLAQMKAFRLCMNLGYALYLRED